MKGSVLLFCDFSTIKAAFTARPSKSTLDSLQSKCSCPNPGHFGSNRVWLLYLQPPATVLQIVLPRMCTAQVHELPSSQPHIGDLLGIHSLPCLPSPSPDLRTLSMWMKWHFGWIPVAVLITSRRHRIALIFKMHLPVGGQYYHPIIWPTRPWCGPFLIHLSICMASIQQPNTLNIWGPTLTQNSSVLQVCDNWSRLFVILVYLELLQSSLASFLSLPMDFW